MSAALRQLVRTAEIVVCTGTGGVGKTTVAATLALEGARQGRRAVVVTIDPAKRLADALGLAQLSNTPSRIDGAWSGELWAMMLDTKSTFDDLVRKYATDAAQSERILANRFYKNISGALSGTQEYMAMEKLYELHQNAAFDLVVVDTPPTRGIVKAVNVAAQAFVRTLSKVVGTEVIEDAITFFSAFQGMEAGFKDRAAVVLRLLSDPQTAFVLVSSPRQDTIAEATFFARRLAEGDIAVRALVVNRMHPRFGDGLAEATRERARTLAGASIGGLYANLADFALVSAREEEHLAGLAELVAPAPLVAVPMLPSDVHDLPGLQAVGEHLFKDGTSSTS